MTINQGKIHVAAIRAQAKKLVELHDRYKVTVKDLAKRFDCSPMLIQDILREQKRKKLPPATL